MTPSHVPALVALAISLATAPVFVRASEAPVPAIGASRSDVVTMLGKPLGAASQGDRETILYPAGRSVLLEHGQVIALQGFSSPRETRPEPESQPAPASADKPLARPPRAILSHPAPSVGPPKVVPAETAPVPAVGPRMIWFQAAQAGDTQTIGALLNKMDIDARDDNGDTALHHAVSGRPRAMNPPRDETIRFLAEAGADIDTTNRWGRTPLHWAAVLNQSNTENLLLMLGANPDIPGRDGHTYADLLRERRKWVHRSDSVFSSVAFGNNLFVAIGREIATSLDGTRWTRRREPDPAQYRSVDFVNGYFYVSVGNGNVLRSSDGRQWANVRPMESRHRPGGASIIQHAGNDNTLLAIGHFGAAWRVTDVYRWEEMTTGISRGRLPLGLAWTGREFVIVDNHGALLASRDGETWTRRATPALDRGRLLRMRYVNAVLVATGHAGTVMRYVDGTGFVQCRVELDTAISDVAYGAGRYVAVGHRRSLLFSSDGAVWHGLRLPSVQGLSGDLMGIAYGNNAFVATGRDGVWSRHGD